MDLEHLNNSLSGELHYDAGSLVHYATDASAYREKPLAVALPKHDGDIEVLIHFARKHQVPLIPRAAGTSLAGQVVGRGIVVDVSKHLNAILEVNAAERWVRVQPGVVLAELNQHLAQYGLFFGPETSTANRCTMGGMLGNNACGLHSLAYGSTREHVLAVSTLLSDGSRATFGALSPEALAVKCQQDTLEGQVYKQVYDILSDTKNQQQIRDEYPKPQVERRNTGYALDLLLQTSAFTGNGPDFNLAKLLAGSEGTLAFTTEIKLNLVDRPPKEKALLCVHMNSVKEAALANLIALEHKPTAIELMDDIILQCTKTSHAQQANRFFVQGDPGAILIIEFVGPERNPIEQQAHLCEQALRQAGYGYHFPLVWGADTVKVWNLRKAGLGALSNMPGDAKPVSVIEDTAVAVADLPQYLDEFQALLDKRALHCVFHAHIATGELHLRPVINLKSQEGVDQFYGIAKDIAHLVKKFRGSLSGEHGDGRLRGEFIPVILGQHNYQLLKKVKQAWDPAGIFNPGKIVDTPSMTKHLRYDADVPHVDINTYFDFSGHGGLLRAVEQCNGAADCRKSHLMGGTMCPSFMATRNERDTTRARANVLREFITQSGKSNRFNHKEIYEVMELCLSCKGCKSECPSNVDMAKLKAEFLQHYYDANGIPLRNRLVGNYPYLAGLMAWWPALSNAMLKGRTTSTQIKKMLGFAPERSLPLLSGKRLSRWIAAHKSAHQPKKEQPTVYLFNDETTNLNESDLGIQTILLLEKLGYNVVVPKHTVSGRTFLSKGMLRKAKAIAIKNVGLLKGLITSETPLLGIEPSAILSFRDEYPDIVGEPLKKDAQLLARHCLTVEEFLAQEMQAGRITKSAFTTQKRVVKLHGHCQQKAVSSTQASKQVLAFPANYTVAEIPSGCCGMAGSFGYEKEHYQLSMQIGELVLFPAVRQADAQVIIAAPGTSCRHQIKDGTGREAWHPIAVLYHALA